MKNDASVFVVVYASAYESVYKSSFCEYCFAIGVWTCVVCVGGEMHRLSLKDGWTCIAFDSLEPTNKDVCKTSQTHKTLENTSIRNINIQAPYATIYNSIIVVA